MKNKLLAICAVLALCLTAALVLTSCSAGLKGTYKTDDGLSSVTFGDDKAITINALGLVDVEGTYEIKDGNITITYILPVLGTETNWVKTFEKDGKTITIGGTQFTKAD